LMMLVECFRLGFGRDHLIFLHTAYIPLDGLPHLVDMVLTCTRVGLGCPGIPPDSEEAKEAASWASCVSIILLKLSWFFMAEVKDSMVELRFSRTFSLASSFLFKLLLILDWPKTRSLMEGWLLKELE
jgi:hypothetical protein